MLVFMAQAMAGIPEAIHADGLSVPHYRHSHFDKHHSKHL